MLKQVTALALLLVAQAAGTAFAADAYPNRPITFIVPWGPGGGADQVARISSKIIEPTLKVSLPVVNMAGATGQTGLTKLLTAPADGYTVEVMTADTFAAFAAPNSRFKLDQIIPIGIMIQQRSGLFANASGAMQTWDDVVKASKERELKVAITGYGSPDDLSLKYLMKQGLKVQGIPFPEPGLRYASVVGGQSELVYEQAGDVRSFLDGAQIKPVLFFSEQPAAGFEDVPYAGKLGYKVTLSQFRVIIVRAGTDPAIVKRLSDAFATVAQTDEFKAYLKQQYAQADSYVPADQCPAYMKDWLNEARALLPKAQGANN